MAHTGTADGRSPGVDPLAVAGPVVGGSIGRVQGDEPMDGILGLLLGLALRAGVRHCGQGSGTTPRLFPPSLRVFRLAVQEPLARRIPGWICLGSQPRSIWVCWSVQHRQRLGVSSFGPHCPPHLGGIGVCVLARSTVWQKNQGSGKTSVVWGKRSVGRSDLSSEGPQSCDPDLWLRGHAGNPGEAKEGWRVWDLLPSPALPTAG